MKKESQDNNFIKLLTPLGKDAIILNSFSYSDEISELFSLYASSYFNGTQSDLNDLIGKSVLISMENIIDVSSNLNYFHGIVSQAKISGSRTFKVNNGHNYKNIELKIEPKLKFCDFRKNSRIFQSKNFKDIVSCILGEHEVDYSFSLNNKYSEYDYKVQYEETDLNFIMRLFEEEGISFLFSHSSSSHTMEIFDDISFYQPATEFNVDYDTGTSEISRISTWNESQSIVFGASVKKGYDMRTPNEKPNNIAVGSTSYFTPPNSEFFEFMGETETHDRFSLRNKSTIEYLQNNAYICSGEANCRTFRVGKYFKFKNHEDKSRVGKKYLLIALNMRAGISNQIGPKNSIEQGAQVTFKCLESGQIKRPKISHIKPKILGIQTAVVTGKNKDEIHIDKYGRIKVQFHWDREGKFNSDSSCWIRVSQQIAGNSWGAVFHPRVGQEVIVEFINGDPDQPIVTSSLYNGVNLPPYSLPNNKSQSGFKSRSVQKGEDHFNELRFEDKPGRELIYIHAEKDHELMVEDSSKVTINNNKVESIKNDFIVDIGNNTSIKSGEIIEFRVGGASICMSSSGNIDIKGTNITINGSEISLKAGKINLN